MKPKLVVVGTTHEEIGKTTVDDLYNVILEIGPKVIFEEIPVNLFKKIYESNELPKTIEVKAVQRYSHSHNVDHFPIDLNNLGTISGNLGLGTIDGEISAYIKAANQKSINELNARLGYIDSMGHKEINTKDHYLLYRKVRMITENYLRKTNRELFLRNEMQNQFHYGIRENNMVIEIGKNIEKYNKSLLLIGYYHLETVIAKLKTEYKNISIIMYKRAT